MFTEKQLVKKMQSDIAKLEEVTSNRKLYNKKTKIKSKLLKTGILINYSLPFLISAAISSPKAFNKNESIFTLDNIKETKKVEFLVTSTGEEQEISSYTSDNVSNNKELYHVTGWEENDFGLFEQTTTTYRFDKEQELEKVEDNLLLTKEELDKKFIITDIKTVQKQKISQEESKNTEDMVVIKGEKILENDFKVRQETLGENTSSIIILLLEILILGGINKLLLNKEIKKNIAELKSKLNRLTYFSEKDIFELKKILKIKKENLSMVSDEESLNSPISADFDFLSPLNNDMFSSFRGKDLLKLLIDIENYNLQYKSELNIPKDITFGLELEYEDLERNIVTSFINSHFPNWKSATDGSLWHGGEIDSPKMTDSKLSWIELKKICEFLRENQANTSKSAGGHIHIGVPILGCDLDNWKKFLKIYAAYESVLFRYGYGDKINGRHNITAYATPIADSLYLNFSDAFATTRVGELLSFYCIDRRQAVNFTNVSYWDLLDSTSKNTLEFRFPNATDEEVIWQNNVNTLVNLLLSPNKECYNEDIVNKKLTENRTSSLKDYVVYNEICLKDALEFVDLIFENNLDKTYFLRQYLKDFETVYGNGLTTKSKKFVR